MATSSLSTYLDVTRAADETVASKLTGLGTEPTATAQAATVLAAIHDGTELVTALPDQTGLETTRVLGLLALLAEAGMVDLDKQDDGTLRARLTEPTRAALTST